MLHLRHLGIGCVAALSLLVGCSSEQRPHDVPSAALRTVEGNQRLVYTASDPGTVWVTEGSSNIIYSTPVAAGDRVVLDPELGKVMLNGSVVLDKDVNHNDHKVFFLQGSTPPAAMTAGDRSISRPDGIPMTATIGGEGKNRVEYTARRDGFAWITDEDQHRVLYSGPVNRGDVVIVDPEKNSMTLNGQSIYAETLNANNHRIFFSNERPAWRPASREGAALEMPAKAVSRVEGTGRVDFVAERNGTVWVTDVTSGRTVYSGRILKNDRLTVDPTANRLTVNSQAVHTADLPNDRYRVYFSER